MNQNFGDIWETADSSMLLINIPLEIFCENYLQIIEVKPWFVLLPYVTFNFNCGFFWICILDMPTNPFTRETIGKLDSNKIFVAIFTFHYFFKS